MNSFGKNKTICGRSNDLICSENFKIVFSELKQPEHLQPLAPQLYIFFPCQLCAGQE